MAPAQIQGTLQPGSLREEESQAETPQAGRLQNLAATLNYQLTPMNQPSLRRSLINPYFQS